MNPVSAAIERHPEGRGIGGASITALQIATRAFSGCAIATDESCDEPSTHSGDRVWDVSDFLVQDNYFDPKGDRIGASH